MDIDIDDLRKRIERSRNGGVLPGTVLEVDWSMLPEEPSGTSSPLDQILSGLQRRPMDLRDTVEAIDRAAGDHRVAGLVARVQPGGGAFAPAQELADAIARFRAAGKQTTAYADSIDSNLDLLLATSFERVVVLGAGSVAAIGLGMATTFFGDTLPWIGLQPEFLQRHEYKNMANVFTETDFTDAHREASEAVLSSMHGQVVAAIAAARGLDEARVEELIASGPHAAADAVAAGLVDETGFRDEVWEQAKGDGELLYLSRYLHHVRQAESKKSRRRRPKPPVIAVVPAVGQITQGRSGFQPGLQSGPSVGADTFVQAVRSAVATDDVEAVVVRIDSPGGSAIASEVMARAIAQARAEDVPFVASMSSVAGSGGYYIAAPCDRIVANPGTITGSIGVVLGKLVDAELREKVKLSTKTITTSDNALLYSSLRPFTDDDRAHLDGELDRTYELFLQRVCEGRDMTRDEVHEVAKGRIWSGADALERGLVDVLGGFSTAVAEAKRLADIDDDAEVRIVSFPKSSPLDFLLKPENSEPVADQVLSLVGEVVHRSLRSWERRAGAHDVQARMYGDIRIR